MQRLAACVRPVLDFPKPGVVVRDITPLMRDPEALRLAMMSLIEPFRDTRTDAVIELEALAGRDRLAPYTVHSLLRY